MTIREMLDNYLEHRKEVIRPSQSVPVEAARNWRTS